MKVSDEVMMWVLGLVSFQYKQRATFWTRGIKCNAMQPPQQHSLTEHDCCYQNKGGGSKLFKEMGKKRMEDSVEDENE